MALATSVTFTYFTPIKDSLDEETTQVKTGLRTLLATIVGLTIAVVLAIAVEGWSAMVHPTPAGFQGTMEEMCEHVARYPAWVLAVVVPLWAGITFLSVWIAKRLGNVGSYAVVVVLLGTAIGFNVAKLPYPVWFKIATPITCGLAMVVAYFTPRSHRPRRLETNVAI